MKYQGTSFFAVATIFSEKSIPVGMALSSRTAADTYPGPHATSILTFPMKLEHDRSNEE